MLVLCWLLPSCSKHLPQDVKQVLKMAGNNRGELEKVISRYKNHEDSLKLEAAYFLIKNMSNKYFYNSDTSKIYRAFFELTTLVWENEKLDIKTRKDRFSFIYDSMKIDKITDSLKPLKYIDNIKASELIENIDLAFVAWETYPWSKNVSFKDFCNYILPYNVFQEPLAPWRETLMNRYRWVLDSIKDPESLREATILINTAFDESMTYNSRMEKIPDILSFNLLDKIKMGKCDHLVTMNIYCLRAMGIPAKIDYAPRWGNHYNGHAWCSINDENGFLYAFDALYQSENTCNIVDFNSIPESRLGDRRAPKILRKTFENQYKNLPDNKILNNDVVPVSLINFNSIDVTASYSNPSVIFERNFGYTLTEEIAFLFVFNRGRWHEVVWSQSSSGGTYKFGSMGTDIVYLPIVMNIKTKSERTLNPFILLRNGEVRELTADTGNLRTIRIDRKYYVDFSLQEALEEINGGIFQGSNSKDFQNAENLFEITSTPRPKTNHYKVVSKNKFRYLRYVHPTNQCRVAEMKFFGKSDADGVSVIQLQGNLISSRPQTNNVADRILDGDVLTYFVAEDKQGGWVGLDLGEGNLASILEIAFYPPNDGNSVEIGDRYNLLFWDKGWKSLGERITDSEELIYENCPENALFLLKDITKGEEERIFTIEDGKQVWW